MAVEAPKNEKIYGVVKNGGGKGVDCAIRRRRAQFGIYIHDIKFFGCLYALFRGHVVPLSHITYPNRCLLSHFQAKTFPLNPVLQIVVIIV